MREYHKRFAIAADSLPYNKFCCADYNIAVLSQSNRVLLFCRVYCHTKSPEDHDDERNRQYKHDNEDYSSVFHRADNLCYRVFGDCNKLSYMDRNTSDHIVSR
jgi:hypothetical protein